MLTKNEEQDLIKSYLDSNELEKFELSDEDFNFIKGAVVLIIGIGNRIGRELFGLIRNKGVASFIFVDASEKAMYDVVETLEVKPLESSVHYEIGDIADEKWMRSIFEVYKPTVCFSFAARTSVKLSNITPEAFITTNIRGTHNILKAAAECPSMQVCIFISSEKANIPSSVYDVTKFCLDFMVRQMASHFPKIRFGTLQLVNICSTGGSYFLRSLIDSVKTGKPIRLRVIDGQLPKRRFSCPATAAKLFLRFAAFCRGGHAFGILPSSVAPIDIKSLASLVCRELGVEDVEGFAKKHMSFVDSEGEKVEEVLPEGAYCVPGMPLYLTPPAKVDEKWLWEQIDRLLVLSEDIKNRGEVMTVIDSIKVAAIHGASLANGNGNSNGNGASSASRQ
jgi:FlaA1/EpsC-like NDP-sugar epimerase